MQDTREISAELMPDTGATERYLALLDDKTKAYTFQTFDDNKSTKDRALAATKGGTLDRLGSWLAAVQKRGAGVYVTVNETTLGQRTSADVRRVRAVWADLDHGLPELWPIKPSIIVESSPGRYQCLWLVDGEWPADEDGRADFADVMDCLVRRYGGDNGAKDIARVLRVPGFYHLKDPANPFQSKLIDDNGTRHTRAEILAAFPRVSERLSRKRKGPDIYDNVQSSFLDVTDVLNKLACISADEYSAWVNVGMGLKETFGEKAFDLWDVWSQTSSKYSAKEARRKWDSFDSCDTPQTYGSIVKTAKEALADAIDLEDFNAERRERYQAMSSALDKEIEYKQANQDIIAKMVSGTGATLPAGSNNGPMKEAWTLLPNGKPDPKSQGNIKKALAHLGVTLFKNEFDHKYYIEGFEKFFELDDEALRALWLTVDRLGLKTPKDFFLEVVLDTARENSRHPVREYLDQLPEWDGKERLDTWLIRYAGAEENDLNKQMGRKFLIGAIRRIRQPGSKFDTMLVLEGGQGAGKSSLVAILAGDWFEDGLQLGSDPKVVIEQTLGKWIIEISELSALGGRHLEHVKAMISRRADTARLAYAKTTSTVPRQFVLIGTTNDSAPLKDTTGNRRFWTVEVGRVDLKALRDVRDQLWAEAATREASGESEVLPQGLWKELAERNDEKTVTTPIFELLEEVIGDHFGIIHPKTLREIIQDGAETRYDQGLATQVNKAMRRLGWITKRPGSDTKRGKRVWRKLGPNGESPLLEFNGGTWQLEEAKQPVRRTGELLELPKRATRVS